MTAPASIPWYKSNTLRALLLAAGAQIVAVSGASDQIPSEKVTQWVDLALIAIEMGALVWAAYARARQPTPPVTLRKETP